MSFNNHTSTPDLASVLRTLASYSQPTPHYPALPPPSPQQEPSQAEEEEEEDEEEYDPSTLILPLSHPQPPSPSPSPSLPPPPAPAPAPAPNSSSITTWPPALRHVMKTLLPNPTAAHRIRHLVRTQHEHERQWWTGREALLQKQRGREEGRKRLDDVLASVGGLVNPLSHDSSPATDISELQLYDRKVLRACAEMHAATTAELARLDVPFFSTRVELVSRRGSSRGADGAEEGEREREREQSVGVPAGEAREGTVDERELKALQLRMLGLLEDLCGGEG